MSPLSRSHLPRLLPEAYRGRQFVHWTMTIADRRHGWLTAGFHAAFRDIMHRLSGKYHVVVPAYCLMPDHLHVLTAGNAAEADQLLWAKATRRALNQLLAPNRLQKQAYDHVLRPAETGRDAFATLVHYICENPVRAGLVTNSESWAYAGACVPILPDLDPRHPDFRERWWTYWVTLP